MIRVPRRAPTDPKSRVNRIDIVVCEHYAEVTKCLFMIALNQEEICCLPCYLRRCWVSFHSTFHTLFLLLGEARHVVDIGQIQPVPGYIWVQRDRGPIV